MTKCDIGSNVFTDVQRDNSVVNRRQCHLTENISLKVQCSKVTKLEQCRNDCVP